MTIRYFIPDWDDRVDPAYDFETDQHTSGRNPYNDDRYAHEIYGAPPYDGILLSRATLDSSTKKYKTIVEMGSVHQYLRLPEGGRHVVMGDCGAFSYWKEKDPPYHTPDILHYYDELGFDLGVSIDHLIVTNDQAERKRRWDLTIDNARDFLRLHQEQGYRFTPVGVAQGWNPESYKRAVEELIHMGYNYIAIGGLARSQNSHIIKVFASIREILPPEIDMHLFGVCRPEHIPTFIKLGITSFDSASRLRKAWTDDHKNYYLGEQVFTAIRIRDAKRLARENSLDEGTTIQKEQAALRTLRAYDRNAGSLDDAYEAILAYGELSGPLKERMKANYWETLRAKPWKECSCDICQQIGVEVIIFRGNNRNRRRGFHNTWQLYQQLQRMDTPSSNGFLSPLHTQQLVMMEDVLAKQDRL
jgi:hypothetical protein